MKLYVAYQRAPVPMTLKVTFVDWNLCNCHTSWNIAWTY